MPRELRRPLAGHDGELELPPGWAKGFAAAPYSLFRECLGVMCRDADHHTYESFMGAWVLLVVATYVRAPPSLNQAAMHAGETDAAVRHSKAKADS